MENPAANPQLRPSLPRPIPEHLIRSYCVSCSEGSFYVFFFSFFSFFFFANFIFYHTPPAQGSKEVMTDAFAGGAFYEDITY